MELIVLVTDQTAKGEHLHTVKLKLNKDKLTLRELIEARVNTEVQQFNQRRPVSFKALVKPRDAEETQCGYRLRQHRDLDAKSQCAEAIDAFKVKCFFVYVNGREIRDLDEVISVDHKTDIGFVKLMPIVAG